MKDCRSCKYLKDVFCRKNAPKVYHDPPHVYNKPIFPYACDGCGEWEPVGDEITKRDES